MIKLTEFTSVVDTYKKNFDIEVKDLVIKRKKIKQQIKNKEKQELKVKNFSVLLVPK